MVQSSMHKLILSIGSPNEFELTRSEIIIGRDPNVDLPIPSPAVSRRHARLTREGEGYVLEDMGSSNGTFLNSERLAGRRSLKSGDQIRLGQAITLTYQAPLLAGAETVVRAPTPVAPDVLQTVIGEEPALSLNASPPKLVVSIAGGSTQTHILTRPALTIGRVEGNDIVVPSQIVSRQHAHLEHANGGYRLAMAPEAKNPILFEGRQTRRMPRRWPIICNSR